MKKKIVFSIAGLFLLSCFLLSACAAQNSMGDMALQKSDVLYLTNYNGVYALRNNTLNKLADFCSKSPVQYQNWLYFITYELYDETVPYPFVDNIKSSKIQRMRLDGTNKEVIFNHNFIDKLSIIGSRIVFNDTKGERTGQLYSMNLDGTERKPISEYCMNFIVYDQSIYVYEINNNQPGIFKVSLDGSTRSLLYDASFVSTFFPYEDKLYIATYDAFNREKSDRIYVVNLNSSESYEMEDLLVHGLVGIRDNWMYYDTYPADNVVHAARRNLTTGEQEILAENILVSIDVSDEYLLYQKDTSYTISALNLQDRSIVTIP